MAKSEKIRCELLGRFRLFGKDGHEIGFPVTKGAAIIAYMLLSGEHSVPRSVLTGLLWSERSEAAARTALRQCLYQMKNRLDPAAFDLLTITQDSIRIAATEIETDIERLSRQHNARQKGPRRLDVYRLLYGWEDLDPAYTEWLWEQRRHQKILISKELTRRLEESQSEQDRLLLAEDLHDLDPCLEIAARPLIEHNVRIGNIVGLLSVYKRLWDALEEQWEEEPSRELQELVGNARVLFAENLPAKTKPDPAKQTRKYVSVLVARVTGLEKVSSEIQNDSWLTFKHNAVHILTNSGADLLPADQGTLIALFGLPIAHENDAHKAVSAALALRDLYLSCFDPMVNSISIGLNTGFIDAYYNGVAAEEVGAAGDTIVTAHKFANASIAQVSILASQRMVRRLDVLFDLKRVAEPPFGVDAVEVVGRVAQTQQQSVNKTGAMIGRAPFIAALRMAWDQAQNEGMQTICLQGPAGIGKTRLAREFLSDMHEEMPALAIVRCNRYDRSAPLEPIHNLLRLLTGQEMDLTVAPEALLQTLIETLSEVEGAVFVDDWHWADDASRSLFQDLAVAMQDHPVLLILAARDTSIDDGLIRTSHQIHVPPLNAKEVQRQAEQVLGSPIDAMLNSKIFQKSGGNPLFLEEICRAIKKLDGRLTLDPISEGFTADLHSLIAGRIDGLDVEDTRIVSAISVNGESVDKDLLTKVLGYTVPQLRLERLVALDLLKLNVSDNTLQFKHGITCDVSYGMIPEAERIALHARYFDAFLEKSRQTETVDHAESLALHARVSGNLINAIEFAEQAGNKALAASSLDQAERQFSTALMLIEDLDQAPDWNVRWLSIALRWARPSVYAASADHMPMLEKAQKIAAELGDDAKLGEVLYWTGYNLIVQGHYAEAIDYLRRSRTIASVLGLSRLETEATAILGYGLVLQTEYSEAEDHIKTAIGAKEKHPVRKGRAPVTSAYLRSVLALIYGEQGRFDMAEEALQTALFRVSDFQHEIESSILTTGCIMLIWRGRWSQARKFARRARHRSERVSAPYMIGTSRCLFCYTDWKVSGNLDNLVEFKRTAHWLDARGMRLFMTLIFGWLSDALADANQFEEATLIARRVLDWTEESGECLGTALACRTLARCAMAPGGGGIDSAREHLSEARKWAQHRGADHEHGACALLEADLLNKANETDAAFASLNEAKAVFDRLGMTAFSEQARSFSTSPN